MANFSLVGVSLLTVPSQAREKGRNNTNPIMRIAVSVTSSNPDYILKTPSLNTVTLETMFSV